MSDVLKMCSFALRQHMSMGLHVALSQHALRFLSSMSTQNTVFLNLITYRQQQNK